MTFPSVRSFIETSFPTDVGNLNLPATINSGDLLIACLMTDGNPGITWDNTSHGTWTQLVDQTRPGTPELFIYVKVADGTEDSGTLDLSSASAERGMGCAFAIQDWYGTLAGVEAASTFGGASSNPDAPSLSPSWGSEDNLWFAIYAADDGSNSVATAYPTNFSGNQHTGGAGGGSGAGYGTSSRENAASSEDPGTYTLTGSQEWAIATIAIRPAAAGGTVNNVTKTDTLEVTDAITELRRRERLLSDTLAVTDNVALLRIRIREVLDALAIADNVISSYSAVHWVALTDDLTVTDALIQLRLRQRELQDTLDVIDFSTMLRQRIRTLTDDLAVTDAVTATKIAGSGVTSKTLTDSLAVTDLVVTLRQRIRLLLSTAEVTDNLIKTSSGIRTVTLTDTITIVADAVATTRERIRGELSTLDLTDNQQFNVQKIRGLLDTLEVFDSAVMLRHNVRELTDSAEIADAVTSLYITEVLNPLITFGIETLDIDVGIELSSIVTGITTLDIDSDFADETGQLG